MIGEKRKNEARRPVAWWLLAVGFILGVVMTLGVQAILPPATAGTLQAQTADDDASLFLTATVFIEQATATARAVGGDLSAQSAAGTPEPLFLTATTIIEQATGTAQTAQ